MGDKRSGRRKENVSKNVDSGIFIKDCSTLKNGFDLKGLLLTVCVCLFLLSKTSVRSDRKLLFPMGAYPGWARMGGWRLHKGKTQDVYPLPRSCLTKYFTNLTHLDNTLNVNKHLSMTHTLKCLMESC